MDTDKLNAMSVYAKCGLHRLLDITRYHQSQVIVYKVRTNGYKVRARVYKAYVRVHKVHVRGYKVCKCILEYSSVPSVR